jgi:uncharacterized membrane protein HdeD (DUF308 family)
MSAVQMTTGVSDRSIRLASGTVAVIVGVVLLVWPEATVTVLSVLLAIDFLLLGVAILAGSIAVEGSVGEKMLGALLGLLGMLAGVAMLGRPLQAAGVIVVVVGAFWVVGGVLELFQGLFGGGGPRWWVALNGLISLGFGVVMLSWPGPTLSVLVWLIGLWSLAAGLVWIIRGFRTPKAAVA